MDTTRLPAKSILKQAPQQSKPTLSDEQKAQAERNRRNLGIALHHANKIQTRKDVEAQILKSIETLLEYPSGTSPTATEAADFAEKVSLFQPSDLAALVEERNADGKCGYALCSKSPRSATLGPSGLWKLKGDGAAHYCSNECLKKSLYVKTQLSEVPAWERDENGVIVKIQLYGDNATPAEVSGPSPTTGVNNRELASERNEGVNSFRSGQVIADSIVEKTKISHKALSGELDHGSAYDEIEGYVPSKKSEHMTEPPPIIMSAQSAAESSVEPSANDEQEDEEQAWKGLFQNLSVR